MSKAKNCILILDYESQRVTRLTKCLENNFCVINESIGENALKKISEPESNIKVVLLNMELQDMFAHQFISNAISQSSAQVIAYTDNDDIEAAKTALEAGAFGYMHEPLQLEMLPTTIERAIDLAESFQKILSGRKLEQDSFNQQKITMAREILAKRALEGDAITSNELFHLFGYEQESKKQSVEEFNQNIKILQESLPPEQKPTVLLVEDDKPLLDGLAKRLSRKYNLLTAQDGLEALNIADQAKITGTEIDVILLDIFLPKIKKDILNKSKFRKKIIENNPKLTENMEKREEIDLDGVDLTPLLKNMHPDSETVIMTAYKISDIAVQCYRNGACTYINKPFPGPLLFKAISRALQRKYLKKYQEERS
ncbi:MAG: hypothetical protein GY730_07095 [bacterium]|nr:hypothetical protein [bacterium]